MKQDAPLKRDKSLQPFSREHHHSLLLCWKIRAGFSKGVDPARIKRYADWFFENHILPHFRDEEKYVFPILGPDDEHVKKAIGDHRKITRLFREQHDLNKSLGQLEETLDAHIRFEERTLFNEIQQNATPEQLARVISLHTEEAFVDNTQDEFWK